MSDIFLSRRSQNLARDIVLIDGFSSSGKSLIGPIFGYLDRVEQWQVGEFYEYIAVLNYLGELSDRSLSAIIKTQADILLYNLKIGRNVNFRAADISSPYYDNLQDIYLKRLEKEEGDSVSKDIIKSNPIIPINIHYTFGYSRALFDGFDNRLKLYILTLRSPFLLIDKWYKNNWVNRLCSDDREFTLCVEFGNNSIPWYTLEYADKYISSTDFEKSMLIVYNLYTRIFKMYKSLNCQEKNKIMIIFFDDYAMHPKKYIDKICKILNTKRSDNFEYIQDKLSLPRNYIEGDALSLDCFLDTHKQEISVEFYSLMQSLERDYLDFYSEIITNDW